MKLIINHNNEIIFKTKKSNKQIVEIIKQLYKNDINKLISVFEGLGEIDIYNSFDINYNDNEITIYGDDGIIILEILESKRIESL
tara:strand:+ start:46 stop:300 length:255 start_codon:yes stop_codon:yes gene_type:complete